MPDYSKADHWSLKAQKEGYPARSVYKLLEMDEKFNLLKGLKGVKGGSKPFKVLDLGAAPGSWSLYVLRQIPMQTGITGHQNTQNEFMQIEPLLVSVDLSPLSRTCDQGLFNREDFCFIQGDFTLSEIRDAIFSKGPYGLIISDAAPLTTGNRSVDTLRSLGLAEMALDFAENVMVQGGSLVVKVFQGGDTAELLKNMRSSFASARSFKPKACRAGSFETYYLGLGKN